MESYAWLEVSHLKTNEKAFLVVGPTEATVGRTTSDDPPDKLGVAFDPSLSRQHFTLQLVEGTLKVRRCSAAKRPLFFEGQALDEFEVVPGQGFSTGTIMVRFVDEPAATAQRALPVELDPTMLSVSREQDASRGLRALLALLPLMTAPRPSEQLLAEMVPLLGEIVPTASVFLVLSVGADGTMTTLTSQVGMQSFAPSRTLIREALRTGQAVSHLWQRDVGPGTVAGPTMVEGVSWALAAPIVAGERSFVLYVIGSELDSEQGKATPGELDRAVLAMVTRVIAGLMSQRSGPDAISGVPGRADFLAQARSRIGPSASLVLLKLEGLREANGKQGYAAVDAALKEAARRCSAFWGVDSLTGRLSGSTLATLVSGADVAARAEDLRAKMAANPLPVPLTAKVAVAGGEADLDRLLWAAEQKL